MPDITVTDIPPFNAYTIVLPMPRGVTNTVLPFAFAVLNGAQVSVFLTPAGAAANDTGQILTYGTDYTVQINPAPAIGGTVTLTVAAPLQARITIVRNTSAVRASAYSDGTLLSASVLNSDFNTTVMIEQEANRYNTMLCPHYNQTEITDNSDYVLPRLVRGQVWVKGLVPGTTTGQEAIIAESITNVLGGAPVSLINPPTIATTIPKFADTAGNLTGTSVAIDAGDNIVAPASINVTGAVNASAVNTTNICRAATFTGTNLNITNANIQTNLTAANGSATNLANTIVTGTFTVNGVANIPGLVLGDINLPQNNITAATITAPTIKSTNMLEASSANITGSLTVTAGGTTTISNQLIAENYSPANFRPVVINATGSIDARGHIYTPAAFITDTALQIRNPANLYTSITRTAGGAIHTLALPNALGNAGQLLSLTNVVGNVGTLSWVDGGGGGGGITATLPVTAGNIPRFTDANGNVGNSTAKLDAAGNITANTLNLISPYPGRNDFHIGPYLGSAYTIYNLNLGDNINIALGGSGSLRLQNFTAGAVSPLCFCDQNNVNSVGIQAPLTVPVTYSITLPAAPPTAVNQPLMVTGVDGQGQVGNTLGWGNVQPKRAFMALGWNATGDFSPIGSVNMQQPTWFSGTADVGTIHNAVGIKFSFVAGMPFQYIIKIMFYSAPQNFTYQTYGLAGNACIIMFRITDPPPTLSPIQTLDRWNKLKGFIIECTG